MGWEECLQNDDDGDEYCSSARWEYGIHVT